MKTKLFLIASLFVYTSLNAQEPVVSFETNKVVGTTLTLRLRLQTAGNVEIDWGNGTKTAYAVAAHPENTDITGILQGNTVKFYNDELRYFECKNAEITNINVSRAALLDVLYLDNNFLTSLDVSANPNLRLFAITGNPISNIDLTNKPALTNIYLTNTNFDACALNALYNALPSKTGTLKLNITGNPGAETSNTSIATAKGWTVNVTGDGSGCSTPPIIKDVIVNYDLNAVKEIALGFSGVSMEVSNTEPFRYDNADFVDKLKKANVGWVRFFGGTSNNSYDWRLGGITEEFNSQLINDYQYMCYIGMHSIRGMGGAWFKDYLEMVKKIGAKTIITVNAFTDSPQSIADLARYVKRNNIQVYYWELSNEPWAYLPTARIPLFTGSTDYLDKVKVYHDSIVSILPDAKTSIFTSVFISSPHKDWRNGIEEYKNKYWSSITFHDYAGGYGDNKEDARNSTNAELKSLEDRIYDRAGKLVHDKGTVISTEWNSRYGGNYSNRISLYGAIYKVEFLMRQSASLRYNAEYLGLYNSIYDVVNYKTKYQYNAVSASELKDTINTSDKSRFDFQTFNTVAGLALTLTNKAINHSNKLYQTEVICDEQVATTTGENIPALFGQIYKGIDGKLRLLLTNKSSTTFRLNLKNLNGGINENTKYVQHQLTSMDYGKQNSGLATDLDIQTYEESDELIIQGYSINLIEWGEYEPELIEPVFVGKPTEFIGRNKLRIDWRNEPHITTYEVGYIKGENKSFKAEDVIWSIVEGNSIIYEDLLENNNYTFWVRAVNGATKGPISKALNISTFVSQSTYIDVVNPKDEAIQIKWRYADNASGYKVSLYNANKEEIRTIDIKENLGCEIDNLLNDITYYVSIRSYNYYGESKSSELIEVKASKIQPFAPHNVTAKNGQSSKEVLINWIPSWVPSYFETFENRDIQWDKQEGNWRLVKDNNDPVPSTCFVSAPEGKNSAILKPHKVMNSHINMWFKVTNLSGTISLLVRYIDSNNYYGLDVNNVKKEVEVYKVVNGNRTSLNIHSIGSLTKNKFYLLSFSVFDSEINYFFDSELGIQNIVDNNPLVGKGSVGLSTNNQETYFDKIDVKSDLENETYTIYASENLQNNYVPIASKISGNKYTFSNEKGYQYYKIESHFEDKNSANMSNIATLKVDISSGNTTLKAESNSGISVKADSNNIYVSNVSGLVKLFDITGRLIAQKEANNNSVIFNQNKENVCYIVWGNGYSKKVILN